MVRSSRSLYLFLIFIGPLPAAAANFPICKATLEADLRSANATVREAAEAILWPLDRRLIHFRLDDDKRPLVVTLAGCQQRCGTSPQTRRAFDAFQIFTTWGLPVLALCAQFPYESGSEEKKRNVWSLLRWVGSPAAALTSTIWNVYIIRKCA